MAGEIMITYRVRYNEDAESSDADRDTIILDQVRGQVEAVRNLFDTNIEVIDAGAVSTLSGGHSL